MATRIIFIDGCAYAQHAVCLCKYVYTTCIERKHRTDEVQQHPAIEHEFAKRCIVPGCHRSFPTSPYTSHEFNGKVYGFDAIILRYWKIMRNIYILDEPWHIIVRVGICSVLIAVIP